jgi:hypothetical protein
MHFTPYIAFNIHRSAQTEIPVPQVYLSCSGLVATPKIQIIIEYMPGTSLQDCYKNVNDEPARCTGEDMARRMTSLFRITPDVCESIMPLPSTTENAQSSHYTIRIRYMVGEVR